MNTRLNSNASIIGSLPSFEVVYDIIKYSSFGNTREEIVSTFSETNLFNKRTEESRLRILRAIDNFILTFKNEQHENFINYVYSIERFRPYYPFVLFLQLLANNKLFYLICKNVFLDIYFSSVFDKESEDIDFNSDHKMLIVGSEIDDSTVRIIDYLSSEPYSVNINAVNFNYFKSKDGKEFLAQSFIKPEENIIEESKSKKRKRAKSIITVLFEKDKLQIGQKLYLKPAIDQGVDKEKVCAEIVNTNQNCLKTSESNELFSFSKLRRIWTDQYNLKDVRKFWGFGVRYDWINESGKNLSEINEE